MKVFLNTGFNIKNLYTNLHTENRETKSLQAPKNTGLGYDTVSFSKNRPITAKEMYFNKIDYILSGIAEGREKDIQSALGNILVEIKKIRSIEAKNLTMIAKGISNRINEKFQGIKGTVTIEVDGPFDTKNIIKFENGVLDEYIEGYEETKDGIITAERKISFWPNGNPLHYASGYKKNGEFVHYDRRAILKPDGTLGLYMEGHDEYNFKTLRTKRRINFRNKAGNSLYYAQGYSLLDSGLPKNGIQVKYLRGKPCYITIEGETRNFDN